MEHVIFETNSQLGSKNISVIYKNRASLPCSQGPETGTYPVLYELSSPLQHTRFFMILFNIISNLFLGFPMITFFD